MRKRLSEIGVAFFDSWITSGVLTLFLLITGILSYSSWLPREGFPAIQFPLTIVQSTYIADASVVDAEVAQPLYAVLEDIDGVDQIDTTVDDNSATTLIYFEEGADAEAQTDVIRNRIDDAGLPDEARINASTIDPAAFLNEYDVIASVYPANGELSTAELQSYAERAAVELRTDSRFQKVKVVSLIEETINPATGEEVTTQTSFSQIGLREEGQEQLQFRNAVSIGISKSKNVDIIELSNAVSEQLNDLENNEQLQAVDFAIGSDFAESIKTQITSLESNLLTGIAAVAVVSFLLLTWRASLITGAFMGAVMMTTMLALLLFGFTLNTITLFALVLALGLFVDDATVIVEAIDANKSQRTSTREAVKKAVAQVGPASIAGTLTTVLVFLPMVFVTGVLGEFIRLLPLTIIIALVTSLVLSLSLIPFFARFLLANKKPTRHLLGPAVERLANVVAAGPRLLTTKRKKGLAVAAGSVLFSLLLVGGSLLLAQQAAFNIFPSADDGDQVQISLTFPEGTSLTQAEQTSEEVNEIVASTFGDDANKVVYGGFTTPNARSADLVVNLKPFSERDVTSRQYIDRLEAALDEMDTVTANISQIDAGPPATEYPFKAQVYTNEKNVALDLLEDMETFLDQHTLHVSGGVPAEITDVKISNTDTIRRRDGQRFFQIEAAYDSSQTSALVQSTQTALEEEFDAQRLENEYGLEKSKVTYDFGQESENTESFDALVAVFPIAIGAIIILLALQFRSLLQPLLIVLAIPFSLFGVFGGLILTNNALSFFSMVGLIGLIGIAVNNTILLTDYANQERAKGKDLVESIAVATKKRFRPLVVTTLTTIVALLPLALTDPFWEPLAYTIIFGLLSSTLLVIIAFPYYYLALTKFGEFVKVHARRLRRSG